MAASPTISNALLSSLSINSPPLSSTFEHMHHTSLEPGTPTHAFEAAESNSPFERLPPELIEAIAFAVARHAPVGVPSTLLNMFLISKRFYDVLGPRNDGFYADLFRERFDWRSAERRWATMKNIEDKREKKELLLESITEARPAEDLKFTLGSFTRPSSPSEYLVESSSVWRPLTSRDYAVELRRRCTVLTRMRSAALSGHIPPSSSRPSSPRLQPMSSTSTTSAKERLALSEPDELTQNLWTCYLMLLENDTRNFRHLIEYGLLRTYMRLFYEHSLLSEALNPGWPRQTAGRALGVWIGWLGGDDLATESPTESDQRFFVLKPYVFGAHKFDAFHAPWTISSLPVTRESHPILPPPSGPFIADLRPRSHAQLVTYMGRKIEITPPILTHAAIFSFFFRVEHDPSQVSAEMNAAPVGAPVRFHLQMNPAGPAATAVVGGAGGLSSRPVKTSLPVLNSRIHDRDFARLASCIDPYSSRGLPTLSTRGDLAGSWEGRFSFFDFDSYREMLGGRMRSLYEGPFGDQPQVWKIEETIVRLGKGQKQGGTGPILNAGYEIGQAGPARSSSIDRLGAGLSRRKSEEQHLRSESVSASSGRAIKRSRSIIEGEETDYDVEERENEDDDGDYEILLSGSVSAIASK